MSSRFGRRSGILSNSYIPPISKKTIARELGKLETETLFKLVWLWLQWPITQPRVTKEAAKQGVTSEQLNEDVRKVLIELRESYKSPKRPLIDRILVDFWPGGLNALQLAQIDAQCLIDRPKNYSWISSTAKIVTTSSFNNYQSGSENNTNDIHDDFIFSLDSQKFLDTLIENLASLYLTHIYVSRHPRLPLVLVRLQVYELVHLNKYKKHGSINPNIPDIISRRPYFLAIPLSSPNIIHTDCSKGDLVAEIILQAVEMTLSSTLGQIKLIRNDEPAAQMLESMHILKGVSRFGASLGSWAPYADGTVDISPVSNVSNHLALKPHKLVVSEDVDLSGITDDKERRKIISSLRFKGTARNFQSDKFFTTLPSTKRQKLDTQGANGNNKENPKNEPEDEDEEDKNIYVSIAPIQYTEYSLENDIRGNVSNNATSIHSQDSVPSIRMRFMGNDVFGGLHELSVEGSINPETVPSWLTGEEGPSTGVIQNGNFKKKNFAQGNSNSLSP
ncbi:hypothetical protein B5S28_g102 [[Candida] boidinii]|uniref:Unnamed protein product n=1 Tax=Candida boidinii TaxID=5477 RepID=A0ACB5TL04_CANBO|nr:hypothetical protein B5S28_g102 [[Candida] boidinii]OWB60443.1 hypothetical protein B5S29_g1317 [[Candida] boidinii]OWB77422.1 hypothetical protein B5S32_g1587 [[Candida] boidinii]GME90220.1 unnamed protein product [[Candida] boidinii]